MANEGQGILLLPRTEDLLSWCAWLLPVLFLLLWDIGNACKRRAIWIPGEALVLSSIIIQLLSFIDYSHISVYSGTAYNQKEVVAVLVKNQLVIDSGRLMMCVPMAYLLPRMARSPSMTEGMDLAALGLVIAMHLYSDTRSFWYPTGPRGLSHRKWSILHGFVLYASIVVLLIMILYAVLIGRSIRKILSRKIPLALSCCSKSPDKQHCKNIRDHVLKCWIVVHASRPDYVIARSRISSTAGSIVLCCVLLSIVKWRYFQLADYEIKIKLVLLVIVIVGQLLIVPIGSIVVVVIRWWMLARYYSARIDSDYLLDKAEDDVKLDLCEFITRKLFRDKRIQEKIIRDRLQLREKRNDARVEPQRVDSVMVTGQFSKYKEALKIILIPGEKADQVCRSSKWAFDKVNNQCTKGHQEGKAASVELIELLKHKAGTAEDETDTYLEAAKHFEQVGKTCWRKIAVLLIWSMIYCYDGHSNVVENAMKAYIQAWDYLDFFESLETNLKLLGWEADKEFEYVENIWKELKSLPHQSDEVHKLLEEKIKQPLRDEMESNIEERDDWLKVVTEIILGANAMANLQQLLAKVLLHCMERELKRAIIEKCNKWAEEGNEQRIFDVAFMTAKAEGVLDEIQGSKAVHDGGQSRGTGVEETRYDESQV